MVYFNLRFQPASIFLAMTLRLAQKTWLKIAQSRGIFPIFLNHFSAIIRDFPWVDGEFVTCKSLNP